MTAAPPVLRRVPGERIVAATDVAASGTAAQVDPPAAGGITFGATGPARRHRLIDNCSHHDPFSLAECATCRHASKICESHTQRDGEKAVEITNEITVFVNVSGSAVQCAVSL